MSLTVNLSEGVNVKIAVSVNRGMRVSMITGLIIECK